MTFLWGGLATVADLEAFVDSCLDVQAYPLAYGMLADQFERIPKVIMRQLFLTNVVSKPSNVDGYKISWAGAFPLDQRVSLLIPTFHLRAIGGDNVFHEFVDRLLNNNVLTWNDRAGLPRELQDLFWMYSVTRSDDVETWKNCLGTRAPASGSSEKWFAWAFETVFSQVLWFDKDISRVASTIVNTVPAHKGLVPLMLMSAVVRNDLSLRDVVDQVSDFMTAFKGISSLLLSLLSVSEYTIPPKWLLGTRQWRWSYEREQEADLLYEFSDQLEALVGRGIVESDSFYERVLEYLVSLRERRAELEDENQ